MKKFRPKETKKVQGIVPDDCLFKGSVSTPAAGSMAPLGYKVTPSAAGRGIHLELLDSRRKEA